MVEEALTGKKHVLKVAGDLDICSRCALGRWLKRAGMGLKEHNMALLF